MAYQIMQFPITVSNFHCHTPIASLLKCHFVTVMQQSTRFQLTQSVT